MKATINKTQNWIFDSYTDDTGNEPFVIREAKEKGLVIATIHAWEKDERGEITREQAEANARLIAEANTMFEALKLAQSALNQLVQTGMDYVNEEDRKACEAVNEAIKRASV
jgi:hypothetical protein